MASATNRNPDRRVMPPWGWMWKFSSIRQPLKYLERSILPSSRGLISPAVKLVTAGVELLMSFAPWGVGVRPRACERAYPRFSCPETKGYRAEPGGIKKRIDRERTAQKTETANVVLALFKYYGALKTAGQSRKRAYFPSSGTNDMQSDSKRHAKEDRAEGTKPGQDSKGKMKTKKALIPVFCTEKRALSGAICQPKIN